jgi:ferredoxin
MNQIFDETVQALYFPHRDSIILLILSFVILISVGLIAVILLRKQKLNNALKIILLSISFVFGGITLGGVPNVVLVIQHIFADFIYLDRWIFLILRIAVFLGLTLVFGRIFCGYVCPLGAIQELASMIKFKTTLDYDRTPKKRKNFLRWGFFAIYAIFSMIWGLEVTLFMNPINGFLLIWTPFNITIFIAFLVGLATVFVSIFIYRPYCRFFCPFGALAALFGKISPLKIRRTKYCQECGICEKICPTLEGFDYSEKGECYYCNRCIDFCSNEMFIDNQKIAQINRLLSTYTLKFDLVPKEENFDKIIKSLIRLLIPYKRSGAFEQLVDALKGKKDMSLDVLQKLVGRMKTIFPDEIEQLDVSIYEKWIDQNKDKWKEKLEPVHLDKLFYGLTKEKT